MFIPHYNSRSFRIILDVIETVISISKFLHEINLWLFDKVNIMALLPNFFNE